MKLARSADKRLRIRSINMPLIRWPRPRVESAAPVTRCTEYLLYSPNNQANFAVLFPKPLGVASQKSGRRSGCALGIFSI